MRHAEEAGRAIGRQILIVKATSEREFNAAFATIVQAGAGALLVGGGPFFLSQRRQLVALASRHALPASYLSRDYLEAGGLMSYGASLAMPIAALVFTPVRYSRARSPLTCRLSKRPSSI